MASLSNRTAAIELRIARSIIVYMDFKKMELYSFADASERACSVSILAIQTLAIIIM